MALGEFQTDEIEVEALEDAQADETEGDDTEELEEVQADDKEVQFRLLLSRGLKLDHIGATLPGWIFKPTDLDMLYHLKLKMKGQGLFREYRPAGETLSREAIYALPEAGIPQIGDNVWYVFMNINLVAALGLKKTGYRIRGIRERLRGFKLLTTVKQGSNYEWNIDIFYLQRLNLQLPDWCLAKFYRKVLRKPAQENAQQGEGDASGQQREGQGEGDGRSSCQM